LLLQPRNASPEIGIANHDKSGSDIGVVVAVLDRNRTSSRIQSLNTHASGFSIVTRSDCGVVVREDTGVRAVVEDTEDVRLKRSATAKIVFVGDGRTCSVEVIVDAFAITARGIVVEVVEVRAGTGRRQGGVREGAPIICRCACCYR